MNDTTVFIIILVICWTLNPFFKKQLTNKLDSNELLIYNHSLCTLLIFIYFLYLITYNKCNWSKFKTLTNNEIAISILGSMVTVFASIILLNLVKKADVSYILPHTQPCILILTLIIGFFFFGESVTREKLIGTLLVIVGLFFINKK